MIAADTGALSAFLKRENAATSDSIAQALSSGDLVFPPVVVTELLSDPVAGRTLGKALPKVALLDILDGYWQRAGENRRVLKAKGLKAKIADTLIAQSCIDHDVRLIALDGDFRHFAKYCGLKLAC
ncbi:MAG: PIN domain-containing protein [Alphaproteobacteria bacterium]|nr:PIN domain-containing protein [Alphaproteobacteria bacterium]MBV9061480.1 PIN domain-containing protein [Alphaproteobacteria bacterium]